MSLATYTDVGWAQPQSAAASCHERNQKERIRIALGAGNQVPRVDEASLARYYQYLSAHLPLPLVAYFPEPSNPREDAEFRCVVLELLDPEQHLGDEFDGLFCKTRKGKYELNLPLIDLCLPAGSFQHQLLDDYWQWFWHWR